MTLHVWTARLSRQLVDYDLLDVTRASAERLQKRGFPAQGSPFAPSWGLLRAAKTGRIDWSEYAQIYMRQMRSSYRYWRPAWAALLRRSRVVLACVCGPEINGTLHCHRVLLAYALGRCGAVYHGEIEASPEAGRQE